MRSSGTQTFGTVTQEAEIKPCALILPAGVHIGMGVEYRDGREAKRGTRKTEEGVRTFNHASYLYVYTRSYPGNPTRPITRLNFQMKR